MGMILWSLWSNTRRPFIEYDMKSGSYVYENVPRGLRPDLPKNAPSKIQFIIERCWEHSPEERPSARWIVQQLELLRSTLSKADLTELCFQDQREEE